MRSSHALAISALTWMLVESSAWALPQCDDEPSTYEVHGWSESGDRVALYREVFQACVGGTRSSVLEIYERGRRAPVVCFDGFGSDPSKPVACEAVTFIGADEAWGGANVFARDIPLPEGFVAADRSLSARGAAVWATHGKDGTTYELEVFPSDPAKPKTLPLQEVPMFEDPWRSDAEPQVKPVTVSVSVSPTGRWAVALLAVTERDDDLEFVDTRWTMIELPDGVPLAAPGDPTELEPRYLRCAPKDDDDDDDARSLGVALRALAKARVHQRVGSLARAFALLTHATNSRPNFALGWAALLDLALAVHGSGHAVSIAQRLHTSCPALATEVLRVPRFSTLRPHASAKMGTSP